MDNDIKDDGCEAYEPPTVEDVPLSSEEQVLAGCKQTTGPSPGRGGAPRCAPCRNVTAS